MNYNLSILLSIIAIVIGLLALAASCCKGINTTWATFLVTVLSVLVTLLIGFQIYSALSIERRTKDLVDNYILGLNKKYDEELFKLKAFNYSNANFTQAYCLDISNTGNYLTMYHLYMMALYNSDLIDDRENCLNCIKKIELCVSKMEKAELKESDIEIYNENIEEEKIAIESILKNWGSLLSPIIERKNKKLNYVRRK
jgi:hypothetical protein